MLSRQGRKLFRLSTTYSSTPPRMVYAVGVPIFDNEDNLKQIVVSSRPILSLGALQEDYERFLTEYKKCTHFSNNPNC